MNFSSKNLTTAVSVIAVVIVLGGIYWYFFTGSSTPAAPLTATPGAAAGGSVFTLTAELSNISFDTSIFSDPRFTSLKDISTPITPESQGKDDPFAPASP